MTIPAHPLSWPVGWRRTGAHHRAAAKFSRKVKNPGATWARTEELTIAQALQRVRVELERMGVPDDDIVVSTNVPLRLDGFPRSDGRAPDDPGVAVYWRDAGATRVMAVDRYQRVADNLAAVAATLDAMRAIERHGGAVVLERAYSGFAALPGPGARRAWHEVLGVPPSASAVDIQAAYRTLRSRFHPDRPDGDAGRFDEVQKAFEAARSEGHA